jgi:hypothetical protein
MNLKNRLKKLEKTTNSGGFCLCFGVVKYEAVFNRDVPGMVEKAPDMCQSCGKPVNKTCLEISFEQHLKNVAERRRQIQKTLELFQD